MSMTMVKSVSKYTAAKYNAAIIASLRRHYPVQVVRVKQVSQPFGTPSFCTIIIEQKDRIVNCFFVLLKCKILSLKRGK